jgi:nucleoside-diphosphate-sugar epimerase
MIVRQPSIDRARKLIGYRPTLTLSDILNDVIAWMRTEGERV